MVEDVDLNSLRKTVQTQQALDATREAESIPSAEGSVGRKNGEGVKVALMIGTVLIAITTAAVIAWSAASTSSRRNVKQIDEVSRSISTSVISPLDGLPTITRLSDPNDIVVAQQLVNLFVSPIAVDGKWGTQTDDGVSRLRSELRLADGDTVDPSVWRVAFSRLKTESDTNGALSRPRRSLQSVSVPSALVLVKVSSARDGLTEWTYRAPVGVDLLKVQLAMSELNPEKTLGGWRFCRSDILEDQDGLSRSWWAYPERLLSFIAEDRDDGVTVVVSEQLTARLEVCPGYKSEG